MTEYIEVTVKVPVDRVGSFYEVVGLWLHTLDTPPDGRTRECEGCDRPFVPSRGGSACSTRCRNRVKYARRKASLERNGGASKRT